MHAEAMNVPTIPPGQFLPLRAFPLLYVPHVNTVHKHKDIPTSIRSRVVIQDTLVETAKQNGISGKRALAQALVWTMARDREEGLLAKQNKAVQDKDGEFRYEYVGMTETYSVLSITVIRH